MEIFTLFGVSLTVTRLVAVLAVLLILYLIWPNPILKKLGIPGPRPLPLLGNYLDYRKGIHIAEIDWIKKHGKIVGIHEGATPMLLVGDADFIKEIGVKQFSHFTNRRNFNLDLYPFNKGLDQLQDDHWKHVRSLMTPTFSAGKMKKVSSVVILSADTLLNNMKEYSIQEKPVNVKELYGNFVMDTIGAAAFGLDVDSQKNADDPFVKNVKKMNNFDLFSFSGILLFLFPKLARQIFSILDISIIPKEPINFFVDVVKQAINLKNSSDQKQVDFLQLMMNAHEKQDQDTATEKVDSLVESEKDQALIDSEEYAKSVSSDITGGKRKGLDEEEVFAQSLLFFGAGYETTSSLLSFLSYVLAIHPEVQEKLIEEVDQVTAGNPQVDYEMVAKMPYLDMVVHETMRLYPPATRIDRQCKEDVTINGIFIPKDMIVNLSIWSVHYDESLWPEPEKFIPERFSKENKDKRHPYAWIPFGTGPRSCVGMRFALLETKIAFVKALQNFTFEVCKETAIPPELGKAGFLAPPKGITLKLKSRKD